MLMNKIISGSNWCYQDNKIGDALGSDLVARRSSIRWGNQERLISGSDAEADFE